MIKQIIYAFIASLIVPAAHSSTTSAAPACDAWLAPPELQARLDDFEKRTGFDFSALISEDSIETFFFGGLPLLNRLARDSNTSVARVLDDQFALLHLGLEHDATLDGGQTKERLEFLDDLNGAFHGLEIILTDGKPTPANAGQLARAEVFLRMMTFGLAMRQLDHGAEQVLNPFAAFDATQMQRVMETLDDGAFEDLLQTFAESDASSIAEAAPSPAPDAPSAEPARNLKRAKSTRVERDLARVLRDDLTLDDKTVYQARTSREVHYQVSLAKSVVKEVRGRHGSSVKRLLRALLTGRGDNSGLKPLFDIGPEIVEIKTVMNGHLRIIGCLRSGKLRLLKVMDIKDTITAYSRRIPSNICLQ